MRLDARKIALKRTLSIDGVEKTLIAVFIRAPYIVNVAEDVEVLGEI